MKAIGISCIAILALLFGVAVQAACLPPQQSEKKDRARDEQSRGTQPQSGANRPHSRTRAIRIAGIRKTSIRTGPDCPSISNMGDGTVTIVTDGTRNVRAITRTTGTTTPTTGRDAAHATGGQITVHGNSAEVTTDTEFLNTGLVNTLVHVISFGFTICPSWYSADIRAFCMAGIGSVSLTHGRNTGRMIGMRRMMCTSSTQATAITCSTAGIQRGNCVRVSM